MFKFCTASYFFEYKIDGYYLFKRCGLFSYEEKISGGDKQDLINFFIENDHKLYGKLTKKDIKVFTEKHINNIKDEYNFHKEFAIKSNVPYDYGTFDNFIIEFTKIELISLWTRDIKFPESFFSRDEKSMIHAGLIKLNNVNMIMINIYEYSKYHSWIEENKLKTDFSKNKINKWSKDS